MKYGTYKGIDYGTVGDPFSKYEITIVLKSDGTYSQKNIITVANITENYTGTFKVVDRGDLGMYIMLSANDAMYQVSGNNRLTVISGSGEMLNYTGD